MPPSPPIAASTGPDVLGTISGPVRVLLYTSNTESRIATSTLAVLHDFAVAAPHRWTVVQELYDLAPLDVPRRHRTGWLTAERLLADGQADGLIAPAEQEIACYSGDRIALRRWLVGVSVFAVYTQSSRYGLAIANTPGATA